MVVRGSGGVYGRLDTAGTALTKAGHGSKSIYSAATWGFGQVNLCWRLPDVRSLENGPATV